MPFGQQGKSAGMSCVYNLPITFALEVDQGRFPLDDTRYPRPPVT
ncbi:hypothetical protein AC519_3427 [Pseudomonas savastanoi]|nr:hypothetical protein AC519_3427 [Pseudomonas savastanoi]